MNGDREEVTCEFPAFLFVGVGFLFSPFLEEKEREVFMDWNRFNTNKALRKASIAHT